MQKIHLNFNSSSTVGKVVLNIISCKQFFSSIDICFNRFDCDRFPNLFIDLLLNSTQFFWSHGLEVGKVKAELIRLNK